MLLFLVIALAQTAAPGELDDFGHFPGLEDAGYVGSRICATCHADVAERQTTHHMAQTARLPDDVDAPFANARIVDSAGFLGPPPERGDVAAILGSGIHGVTPILSAPGRRIRESPLSYSTAGGAWFATPGIDGATLGLESVEGSRECLSCHFTRASWRGGILDPMSSVLGVQCERCHGPASRHVEAVSRGETDSQIFNAGRLAPNESLKFCAQCHREPTDVEPLEVLTRAPVLARHSGVGLMMSACFRESRANDTITCLDCHSPHENVGPAEEERSRETCLRCHTDPAARHKYERVTPASNCTACHMPTESSGFYGMSFTDHWIRAPGVPAPLGTDREKSALEYLEGLYRSTWRSQDGGDERQTRLAIGLAEVLYGLDQKDEAFEWLADGLSQAPTNHQRLKAAAMFREGGARENATETLRAAVRNDPDLLRAHYDLGQIAAETGADEDAVRHYERALSIRADFAPGHASLAASLRKLGRWNDSLAHYRESERLRPGNPFVLEGLAWVLATHPEQSVRSPEDALAFAERAAAATEYRHPGILDTLAAAYASSGDFETARNAASRARTMALEAGLDELAAALALRLKLYEENRPYVESMSSQ